MKLNLGAAAPRCPLCGEWMVKEFRQKRMIFVFACNGPACDIVIRVDDPFVGKWDMAYHNATDGKGIPCPRPGCEASMRYFATSTGYMKAVCPKCKASVANGGTRKEGTVENVTPENPGVVQ